MVPALSSPPWEMGVPFQRWPKLQPIPGPETRSPATLGIPPGPWGTRPGPDSEIAWHCNSLRFNSSGTHYATWHQPLTWLQGGELPGGTRAGSLLGAPLRRGRATSLLVARSKGLGFTVLVPNAPQEIMQNKRGRGDGRQRGGRALRAPVAPPLLARPSPFSPKQRTTATGGVSSCSSCSVTSICAHEDEPLVRSHPSTIRQRPSHALWAKLPLP